MICKTKSTGILSTNGIKEGQQKSLKALNRISKTTYWIIVKLYAKNQVTISKDKKDISLLIPF